MKKKQTMQASKSFNRALMGMTGAHRAPVIPIKASTAGVSVSPKQALKSAPVQNPEKKFNTFHVAL
jgi:hypothetical protein